MQSARSDEPLVSVIVPTYGRPEAVLDAVESVRAQTYSNVELVVVDDCSPESVEPSLGEALADAPFEWRVVRHEENRGANAARNTGMETASGAFYAFLDDDDRWTEDHLSSLVDAFRRQGPQVGVAYSGSRIVNAEGTVIGHRRPDLRGDIVDGLIRGGAVAPFSRVMVRASVVGEAGSLDERFPNWQDREWYFRLAQHCEFAAVERATVVRRVETHEHISQDFEKKRDVSFPLLVERHRPLAREKGWLAERQFMAALTRTLAVTALTTGNYRESVRFAGRSFVYYPSLRMLFYFLLALGGPYTHKPAERLKRRFNSAMG